MNTNKKNLAIALKEICASKPLDNVTVTEITKKANLTRQIFYHHFVDKYELAKWIHIQDYLNIVTHPDFKNQDTLTWKSISKDWLTMIEKEKNFYRNLYYSSSENQFLQLIHQHMFNAYDYILKSELNGPLNETVQFQLEFYCIGMTLKIHEWIKSSTPIPAEQFCNLLFESMPEQIKTSVNQYTITKQQLISQTQSVVAECEVY
ncbi:MAG: TetR/AcrR family transcriptional regulator C-terminal domain-containing protein [Erysipelotrichaceae bacterium]|nr:TetR/AcrR family transcriptional regulator C-terminal domain-containing protein [Erysipelotrichaceae bacterium]